jgi:DNA-binding FrmR family transcriptional regulator
MNTTNEYKTLLNRLSRAEGQIKALQHALEHDEIEDCKQFISQIKAARSALKRTSELYVLHHIKECQALPEETRDEQIESALRVLASD